MTRMVRKVAATAAIAGFTVALAAPAGAHIEIDPATAPAGTDAVLTFVVPNEIDTASTTKIVLAFPAEHPIAAASIEPVPGWTAKVDNAKVTTPIKTDAGTSDERVAQITWSGGKIAAGEFARFSISVGLPDAGPLEFKVLQTYSNGETVRWIQDTVAGQAEPDHPAPVLTLTKGDAGTGGNAAAAPSNPASKSDVDSAKTLGLIGVILGALALIATLAVGLLMRRSPSTS